jgi:dUTP pyrophosphatase
MSNKTDGTAEAAHKAGLPETIPAAPAIEPGSKRDAHRRKQAPVGRATGRQPLYWYTEHPMARVGHPDPEHQPDPDDAGADLASTEEVVAPPGGFAVVPTGMHFEPPPGVWLLLIGRSSTWHRLRLIVVPTVIDNGWRGPLYAQVYNPNDQEVRIPVGSRVVQIVPLPQVLHTQVVLSPSPEGLIPSRRGSNGLGSSGI